VSKAQDDDSVMSLVELAMGRPPEEREAFLRAASAGDEELFRVAWEYVQWNHRMGDFLAVPLCEELRVRQSLPGEPIDDHAAAPGESFFDPGDKLSSRFRIVREVARGGMGIVYEAHDEKLDRRIALKCARSGFQKRLPPEVRHASEITHPNVCRIFEIHTATTRGGEVDFFTMELLQGETLRVRLAEGPLPESEAVAIGSQIVAGVAEAHRRGVVHGDLKSNNVILARNPDGSIRAVVTDFGLARGPVGQVEASGGHSGKGHDAAEQANAVGLTRASQAGGTPGYMAPELWKGERPTIASDVFALGVILYELVANRRPYPPDLSWEDRIRPPATVNHPWNPILQRCLRPAPEARFRNAGEVAAALEPSHSRRWWIGVAAAIALSAVSGWATYQRAVGPKETIRLAMLALQPDPGAPGTYDAHLAETVSRAAAAQFAKLNGGERARFSVVPWSDVIGRRIDSVDKARAKPIGATDVVRGSIAWVNGQVELHAYVAGEHSAEWSATYNPGEAERYAPAAIGGMVTSTLRLDPLRTPLNARAAGDYAEGLRLAQWDSTFADALRAFERAVNADADSPLTWAGLAEAQWYRYHSMNDAKWLERSSESLRQARNRNLDLAAVHRVNGLLLKTRGLYEQAETEYLRAIELEPKNADAYRRLGQAYHAAGKKEKALEAFTAAVRIEPGDYRIYEALGYYYDQQGDYVNALPEYVKGVELAPDEADAHRFLGTAYRHLERYDEAERELRKAVQLAPTPATLGALAGTLMYLKRDTEAIGYYRQAVGQSPDDSLWWMPLGIAYARTGQPDEARRAFSKGLTAAQKARDPRDAETLSRVAFFSARLHDPGPALFEIRSALQLSPESTAVQETAVWTYHALGRDDEAIRILETSDPDVLRDVASWPDLAGLCRDPRFNALMQSRNIHVGK